jgi:Fe-S-cluster containining protein
MDPVRNAIKVEAELARRDIHGNDKSKVALRLSLRVYRSGDGEVQKVLDSAPKEHAPACKEGCSWCCRGIRVDVLVPEAITIAEYLRFSMPTDEFDHIRRWIADTAARTRNMTLRERRETGEPCPLLEQETGMCSVYDVRPARCRAHNSLDAGICERTCKSQDPSLRIPVLAFPKMIFDILTQGESEGIQAEGLDSRSFELVSALDVALNDANAGKRWASSERLFDAALRPADATDEQDLHALGEILKSEIAAGTGAVLLPETRTAGAPRLQVLQKGRNALKRDRRALRGK